MTENRVRLDPPSLRALAHPLRVRILGLLREQGPSTATRLAALVGESTGSTSYHLRRLAADGFIEPDDDRGAGRERWWRPVTAANVLTSDVVRESPVDAEGYLRAVAVADFHRHERFLDEVFAPGPPPALPPLPSEWDQGVTLSNVGLRLTAGQAGELLARIEAVLADYPRDDPEATPEAGTERYAFQWQAFPQRRAQQS